MVTAGSGWLPAAAGVLTLCWDTVTHTQCCSERQEWGKQEVNREAFLARIPWKLCLGGREQRQERKGPLILRGEHQSFAAVSRLPTVVLLPEQ